MNASPDTELVERFLEHIDQAEPRRALDLAACHLDTAGVPGTVGELLAPAQRTVGERWHAGRYTVAQEHLATAVVDDALGLAAARMPPASRQPNAVAVVCAEGEWHSTPARMAALLLRDAGWRVHFLGASTPASHLAITLDQLAPQAVAVSCTIPLALPGIPPLVDAAHQLDIPVIAGGRAFDPFGHRATMLGADGHATTPMEATATLNRWLDHPPEHPPATLNLEIAVERADLSSRRREIVASSYQLLESRLPAMARFDARQRHHTRQDLDYILRYLDVALLVDDPSLFTDFIAWLTRLLTARELPPSVMPATLAAILDAAGRDLPAIRHFLDAAGSQDPTTGGHLPRPVDDPEDRALSVSSP